MINDFVSVRRDASERFVSVLTDRCERYRRRLRVDVQTVEPSDAVVRVRFSRGALRRHTLTVEAQMPIWDLFDPGRTQWIQPSVCGSRELMAYLYGSPRVTDEAKEAIRKFGDHDLGRVKIALKHAEADREPRFLEIHLNRHTHFQGCFD